MITLVLEASTYTGSVAVLRDGALLAERTVAMRGRDHEALMPAVAEVLALQEVGVESVERVVCGSGPGAFTSLRIAASIAKGIASAANAILVPISSMLLIAAAKVPEGPGRWIVVSDAMRDEAYVQGLEIRADGLIAELSAIQIVASIDVEALSDRWEARPIGPQRPGSECVLPLALNAQFLGRAISESNPADLAAWEPGYGRLPEAQVKWEAAHGRPLGDS